MKSCLGIAQTYKIKQEMLLGKIIIKLYLSKRTIVLLLTLYCFSLDKVQAQETQIQYLSGTGNDNTKQWQFYCTEGRNAGKWTAIEVPSCWEQQGFGKYDYGFAKDSIRGKENGLYKYGFRVPAAWKGKKINIVFEGSMTDTEVKINGQAAGPGHEGAFYSFKYDISGLLRYDRENLLEVTVAKQSGNASVNAAERKGDFWIFGGIFRPVYLEALPQTHIESLSVDARGDGLFTAIVALSDAQRGAQVTAQLYSMDGRKTGTSFTAVVNNSTARLTARLSGVKAWTAETPVLYKVVFTLVLNGKALHTVSKKVGFRTIEVRQRDGVYINGAKIKFKGVNRHSFWPESGRTTSKAISIEDVRLMKDMNMNAVRMSHYPPDDHFLDVCDSLGLYVMDELAGWHGHYDTPTGTKLVKEMLEHDRNHASVIFWANGNEGGHNFELDPLFAEHDLQKRPVIHPWQAFGGFDTQHYREYDYGIGNYMHGHNIVMPTEFLHGLYDGGHGAGLEDYWEAMWQDPLAAGGFLWDFADEGVVRTDKNGEVDTDKDHGADGIVGPHHEREGSYDAIKEIWSPVKIERKEITPAFNGRLTIENRYAFTNTAQCTFSWKLQKFIPLSTGIPDAAHLTGTIVSPDIMPFAKGTLQLKLPAGWQRFDALYVTAKDPYGGELFTWSFPITLPGNMVSTQVSLDGAGAPVIRERDSVYHIRVKDIQIIINRNNGRLVQVRNEAGTFPFSNGPVIEEGQNNFSNFSYHPEGKNLVIESAFDRKTAYNTLQWTVYPSGWIKMQVRYFPGAYFTSFAGVNFSLPEKDLKGVDYMGYGPYRVWKNRMRGNRFGVFSKAYNNTETGEAPFVYPEFKGYHASMYWCRFKTTTQPFTVLTENEDVFLRLLTPAPKTDQWHNYEPLFPDGDISFMQGISGIGTKTQRNETTGPMGAKNILYDYEKDPSRALELTLYFDFSGKEIK